MPSPLVLLLHGGTGAPRWDPGGAGTSRYGRPGSRELPARGAPAALDALIPFADGRAPRGLPLRTDLGTGDTAFTPAAGPSSFLAGKDK